MLPYLKEARNFKPFFWMFTLSDIHVIAVSPPYGKSKMPGLPVGFFNAPCWAQATMKELFSHLSDIELCTDGIEIFSTNFLMNCNNIFNRISTLLQSRNFTIKHAK